MPIDYSGAMRMSNFWLIKIMVRAILVSLLARSDTHRLHLVLAWTYEKLAADLGQSTPMLSPGITYEFGRGTQKNQAPVWNGSRGHPKRAVQTPGTIWASLCATDSAANLLQSVEWYALSAGQEDIDTKFRGLFGLAEGRNKTANARLMRFIRGEFDWPLLVDESIGLPIRRFWRNFAIFPSAENGMVGSNVAEILKREASSQSRPEANLYDSGVSAGSIASSCDLIGLRFRIH
jgi:hypothetical protein